MKKYFESGEKHKYPQHLVRNQFSEAPYYMV